eukprot:COSAG04_NODE_1612_length_6166_cov_1.761661_3_plen_134_part_00
MPKKGRQSKQEKLQARQKKAGGAEGDEASAGLVWGLRAAMGLVVAFGVLTSGAFDWVFTWLASVPLQTVRSAAAVGEWAPERLAEAAVAAPVCVPQFPKFNSTGSIDLNPLRPRGRMSQSHASIAPSLRLLWC